MKKSNRRKFLAQTSAVAAAVALPSAAQAQTPPAAAGEESSLARRQAAGEAAAVQRRRVVRQSRVRLGHRRALRRRHQGAHQTRPRRNPEGARVGRLVDGESAEGERLPERLERLRGDERSVSRALRPRTWRADDDCRRRRHSRQLARRDRLHRVHMIEPGKKAPAFTLKDQTRQDPPARRLRRPAGDSVFLSQGRHTGLHQGGLRVSGQPAALQDAAKR